MINEKELLIANTSYTKKDFYQIYPEILDLVQKITERWDPQSSNESDPGVVLLKLLAFIADKNNYNIDKNILECFMPSATQETSMRKLCEMMGYNMSYYKSATTKVSFMYQGDLIDIINPDTGELIETITLKAFDTSIKDESDSINYVLLEDVIIGTKYEEKSAVAIEGSLNYCTVGSSNIIKLVNLDDNKRFYLPETMIAENGIFVKNTDASWSDRWVKIDNLNTQVIGSKVWKFGVDSNNKLPYIEFPEDINALIENGLEIAYIVTTGANGNIKANVLTKLANNVDSNGISLVDDNNVSTMVVSNISATSNGSDYETLDEAYNNFKRTIGTFDTLITCRDYANNIYQLVKASDNTTPLVSNIQVSDIRDDINRRDTITTYGGYGLVWEDVSHEDAINHFDLYFYPFGAIVGSYNLESYKNSFRPSYANISEIEYELNNYKTIAHKINYPEDGDIYCIKNMYNLKAKITTTYKVTSLEETQILNAISNALYKKFNMRNIDFGEEIPFDNILECIQNADTRIKNVSLEEPTLTTKYMSKDGVDHDLLTDRVTYIKLIAKNVMAGRIPLFAYDDRFKYEYGNSKFTKITGGTGSNYDEVYGYDENDSTKHQIVALETEVTITPPTIASPYTLKPNEVVQMIAPSFKTTLTYPAYINYHFKSNELLTPAIACVATEAIGGNAPTSQAELNAGKTIIGGITYPYYTRALTTRLVGRLVGTDGTHNYLYRLAASTIYNPSTTYYLIGINEGDTIGADAIIPGINANQEYRLNNGDILYINYTDSNDNIINVKYEYKQITTNGIVESVPHVIIKPNFEIQDSALLVSTGSKVWVKTSGFQSGWVIDGMFSIGTNQQIDVRDYVKNTLSAPTFCYWLIKDGTIPFDDDNEYILQDSEYFFYTNEAKTELVILGSGTKLINHDVAISNFTIDYTEAKLDIDEVSNNGLAAFAGDPWKLIQFRADAKLKIQEMQFITLIEGDILNKVVLSNTEESGSLINNDFKDIDSAIYTIKGGVQTSLDALATSNDSWQIRSRLDLNMGPELQQKLDINQKIVLYDGTEPEPENRIITLEPSTLGEDIKCPYLKSNILLQMAGNKLLNAPVTITEEEALYNLNIMVSSYEVPTYDKTSTPTQTGATLTGEDLDGNIKVNLKNSNNIKLNVLIPDSSNTFGIMMLYYNKKSDLAAGATGATITADGAYLQYYNGEGTLTNPIALKDGINIIKVINSTLLTIERNDDKEGILVIGKYKIVKNPDVNPEGTPTQLEGVDYQTLGLNPLGTVTTLEGNILEANYLLNYIKEITAIESNDIFYYNCPIDNSLLIDHEDMSSPLAWYDYNNICNKFVISELDADKFEKGISLTKSSKL